MPDQISVETAHFINWICYSGNTDVRSLVARARELAEVERQLEQSDNAAEGVDPVAVSLVEELRDILDDELEEECPAWPREVVHPPVPQTFLKPADYAGTSLVLPLLRGVIDRIDLAAAAKAILANGDAEP